MDPKEIRTAVVYHSKNGSTEKYAKWIAEECSADLFREQDIKGKDLDSYDVIVYGGGIYSGGIKGIDFLRKNMKRTFAGKIVIAFAVGISVSNAENREQCNEINFSKKHMQGIKCFYLPGAYDPSKVTGLDKKIMDITRKMIVGGNANDFGATLLGYIDNGCDLIDKSSIEPLVSEIKDAQAWMAERR